MKNISYIFILIIMATSSTLAIDNTKITYQQVLEKIDFSNIQELSNYIQERNTTKNQKKFFYGLTTYFLKQHPISMSNIEESISIGEKYLTFTSTNKKNNDVYRIIGYYILSHCAYIVEQEFKDKSSILGWSDSLKNLKKRLEKLHIYLKIKENDTRKILKYIKGGNFDYLKYRFCTKFCPEKVEDNNKSIHLKLLSKDDKTTFLLVRENKRIGELIWLKKEQYKINYLAGKNVGQRYKFFLEEKQLEVKALMTGAFTNLNSQIEGLTFEKGKIVNAVLLQHRDGLILIDETNKLFVINLKNKKFMLPHTNTIIDPFNKIMDYSKLLQWGKKHKAAIFQTQLLAYKNQTLIKKNSKKSKLRERRLLVLITNQKGEDIHLIVNITQAIDLANLNEKIIELIKKKQYHLNAILNLDTGGYDIFHVYNKKKEILSTPISLDEATNLIFYTPKH